MFYMALKWFCMFFFNDCLFFVNRVSHCFYKVLYGYHCVFHKLLYVFFVIRHGFLTVFFCIRFSHGVYMGVYCFLGFYMVSIMSYIVFISFYIVFILSFGFDAVLYVFFNCVYMVYILFL